jgi:hypothetical protein
MASAVFGVMAMIIDVIGIYAVESRQPCHLVELLIRGHTGRVDIGSFTQERPGRPRSDWQAPWDERVLNAQGTADILGQFPSEIVASGEPLRLVFFFHSLDFNRPFVTPAGEVALQGAEERPPRLAFLEYDSPC